MKLIYIFVLVPGLLISSFSSVNAIADPFAVPNNKYGIHIIDENDLYDAARLVNLQGGDWGYVTMVIRDDDRDLEKWQKTFDLFGNWHLIPIIRIATHLKGDMWEKPNISDAKDWVDFLSRLHWPVKNRYVIIFNEPNHSKEWSGSINPGEYAQILAAFSEKLKSSSPDFFILPAGMDASAPNSQTTMDEVDFLKQMTEAVPDIFSTIDGWTSHSYPNPGFAGKVTDTGRGTLQTYLWEMETLKSLGIELDFPIFITETGWVHQVGVETISRYLKEAANTVWNDPKIAAITPFILNYQSYPFADFSWRKLGEDSFFEFYDTYKSIPKLAGQPEMVKVFEKFSGLKIEELKIEQNKKFNFFFNFTYLRSLFSRLFKL